MVADSPIWHTRNAPFRPAATGGDRRRPTQFAREFAYCVVSRRITLTAVNVVPPRNQGDGIQVTDE